MSSAPQPLAPRTRSSARIASKNTPPPRNNHDSEPPRTDADEHESDICASEDYTTQDLDESEEGSFSNGSDLGSDLDLFDEFHSSRSGGKSKRINTGANVRSVETATSRSKTHPINDIASPQMPGGFMFLELESYICYCTDRPSFSQMRPQDGEWDSRCKVLDYFGMVFVKSLGVLYCPAHNQITPMSEWAIHVRRSHLDWCSANKKKDCDSMARHVANSHNLSMTERDLDLPDEIDEPLSTKTSNLHLNYQCPQCGQWMVADKGSNFPERFIREKHIRNKCPKGPCPRYNDIDLAEPRWIFKVRISAKIKFHSFILPLEWESCDKADTELALSLEPPSWDVDTPHVDLAAHQEWPLTLGWHAYDQEISANDHVVALRGLIALPGRINQTSTSDSLFLEKGLRLVQGAIVTYFHTAVSFIHDKHKGVVDAITLDSKKAKFRFVSDGKISEYSRPSSMVICMMLRFIHTALTNGTEKYGPFKLRGVHAQFREAVALYCLIAETLGDVGGNDLHWAVHSVLEALLKPLGLGTRPIDCPTDQMAFLWAFLSSTRYRISKDLSSLMAGCKFGFRCTEIHSARVQAQKKSKNFPFYDDIPYGGSGSNGESDESDGSESGGGGNEGEEFEILHAQGTNPYAADESPGLDMVALLERMNNINPEDIMDTSSKAVPYDSTTISYKQVTDALILQILTEDHQWLSATPKDFKSTPYSRVAFIQSTISPYCLFDGTVARFNISRDGQMASYSTDGTTWCNIDYQKWSSFILQIISMIRNAVAQQMPSGMTVLEVANSIVSDDLSKTAPHKQEHNKVNAEITAEVFQEKMMSPAEDKHNLFDDDGTLSDRNFRKYITQDQDIKGLLCTLLAICSAVPMRPWQFGSIVFDSCTAANRNVWLVDGRFVVGKPKAKQQNLDFADTAFWFPQDVTSELIAYLYYQQPFICCLLKRKEIDVQLLYASHVWALPSTLSRKTYSKVWNGQDVNRKVRNLSSKFIGTPADLPLLRQSSEGLLRNKIPALFQIFQSRDNIYLEEGSYRHKSSIDSYAIRHSLKGLAIAANMPTDVISACLIIGDIWLCMHKIVEADPIWQPMVVDSYIFPMVAHDALAFLGALNQKMISYITFKYAFDQDSLTRGIILLADIDLLEAEVEVDPCGTAAGYCFLKTIRTVLFRSGRPQYGQRPPIGGILLCDLVKAGTMILYAADSRTTVPQFEAVRQEQGFLEINRALHQRWATEDIPWIAISATIFDICPTVNSKATTVTATLLNMDI